MKIGIITFHCAYNFGSALQTYALRTYLTGLGHDVQVIDYRSADFDKYRLFRMNGSRSFVSDFVYFPRNFRQRNSFRKFWQDHFNLTPRTYQGEDAEEMLERDMTGFDALITGSDQIWNLDCTHGPQPPYFLAFAPVSTRCIAYAPSLSHMTFENRYFTPDDKRHIHEWLDGFDAISVRELSTAAKFQAVTDKTIVETVDPTLLLNPEMYRKIESERLPRGLREGKFLFAYTLWSNDDMIHYMDALAEKHGLKIAYYSKKPIRFASSSVNCYGMGPSDFLALIDKADCVVSNSFHATVFSVLFNKPFLTFGLNESTSRMRTLLNKLGLPERHLVSEHFTDFSAEPFASPVNRDQLTLLRKSSVQFIADSLTQKGLK